MHPTAGAAQLIVIIREVANGKFAPTSSVAKRRLARSNLNLHSKELPAFRVVAIEGPSPRLIEALSRAMARGCAKPRVSQRGEKARPRRPLPSLWMAIRPPQKRQR